MEVLQELMGISYLVVEKSGEIFTLVNTEGKKEWESKVAAVGRPQFLRAWLSSLPTREWHLEKLGLEEIKLSADIMDYVDSRTGFVFKKDLEGRKRALGDCLATTGKAIPPLVVRAEDRQLMDGYCRYHVLKDRGVTETLAYVGALRAGPVEGDHSSEK